MRRHEFSRSEFSWTRYFSIIITSCVSRCVYNNRYIFQNFLVSNCYELLSSSLLTILFYQIFFVLHEYFTCDSRRNYIMCKILKSLLRTFLNKVIDMVALEIDAAIHILFCMFRRTTPLRVWQSMSMYF